MIPKVDSLRKLLHKSIYILEILKRIKLKRMRKQFNTTEHLGNENHNRLKFNSISVVYTECKGRNLTKKFNNKIFNEAKIRKNILNHFSDLFAEPKLKITNNFAGMHYL